MTLNELIDILSLYQKDYGEKTVKLYDPYIGITRHIERIGIGAFGSVFIDIETVEE